MFSAFNPSKWSSGQPTLRRPGSSWGFGALLKGLIQDFIISHKIVLTHIDNVPQSDDVTDHFLVSCILHINDINYKALRYRPGRTIVPATKDGFISAQLLCVPINTDELDKITSNMGTIFSNTLETVAPIKLKKVREKHAGPWYNSCTHSLKKETRNLERK